MLTASLAQEAFVAIRGVAEPQQCERAMYWRAFSCVSTRRMGFVDRLTSMRRSGADTDGSPIFFTSCMLCIRKATLYAPADEVGRIGRTGID
jgi:hypothetical protein